MPGPLDRGWGAVVVCASGPSFSVEQGELIAEARAAERCRVIVVNDNWQRVPTGDVCYGCDIGWWRMHIEAVRARFRGELWTQWNEDFAARDKREAARHAEAVAFGLNFVRLERGAALLPHESATITCGSNSGFQALSLARLFGARRIVLVGVDCNGNGHWFGRHPAGLANGDARTYIKHFDAVAPALRDEGIDVINCSPISQLQSFRRADLSETLA